jgi:rhodanese-related sulfurtransferase
MKKIKLHYYKVEKVGTPMELSEAFEKISKLEISDRTKSCGYVKVRLDHVELREGAIPHWILRFSRLREDNWPGVSTLGEASKDLEFDDDTFLSEETYALYEPKKNRMLIQYNHIGVRASKIQEYLTQCINYADGGYRLIPVLTDDALTKYQSKKIVTSIDVVLDDLTQLDVDYFEGHSLHSAVKSTVDSDAVQMKMTFSVDARVKKNKLQSSFVTDLVDKVFKRNGDNDKISVYAKEEEADAVEFLSLLESRKGAEYDAESISRTIGRRYEPDDMFQLLQQAHREWEKSL